MTKTGKKQNMSADWVFVYPAYFDAELTVAEGRRVPKELAFAAPKSASLATAAVALGFETLHEPQKRYTRQAYVSGRVRIRVRVDGTPVKGFETKAKLLRMLAQRARVN